ncbi:MAG: hypothetical protein PVH07_07410, partial [Chloroflexota bacterium]
MRTPWLWSVRAVVFVLTIGLCTSGIAGATPAVAASAEAIVADVEWQSMDGPPGAGHVRQLVQTTEPVHTLYALTDTNLYASSTRGDSWAPVDELEGRWVSSIALQSGHLITCGHGVHRLDPAGLRQLRPEHCSAVAADAEHIVTAAEAGPPWLVSVSRLGANGIWDDLSPPASLFDDLDRAGRTGPLVPGPIAIVRGGIIMGVRAIAEEDAASDGGLFRWDIGDETWTQVDPPAPDRAIPTHLITDPRRPRHVIVTYGDPVLHEVRHPVSAMAFESKDGGRTWRSVTDSTRQVNAVTDVVDVGRDRYLLHPYDGYMLRLRGRQETVVPMPKVKGITGSTSGLDSFLVDPQKPRYVYGVTGQSWELGLVRSTDRMKTWHKMDGTIVGSSPTIVVSHPDDPDVVMTSGNVIQESYATRNDGRSWQLFSPTSSGDELRIDPHDAQHVIVIDEMTTMFESNDGGRRFRPMAGDFGAAKVLDLEIAPDDPSRFYVSLLGVGISRWHNELWQHMSGSPDYAYDIEIDPDDSRVLFATYSPKKFEDHASVWRYRPDAGDGDPGAGWSEILRVDDSAGITTLRFDPSDHDTLYAGVTGPRGGIRVSHDRGERWSELNPALTFTTVQGHSQLEVVPGAQDTVFAGTWGGGSFRSTDSGGTWTALDEEHAFSPTCIESWPGDPDVVYACDRTAPRIHRSTDGGETWEEFFDFGGDHLTTTALAIHPADPDVVYAAAFRPPAAMFGSFYRIRDGEIEADLGRGLPRAVLDIALDESDPSQLYVSTHLHGLFASSDGGASWRRLDDRGTGLPRTGYLDVDVDPADPRTLYASSLCGPIPGYVIDPLRDVLSRTEPYANIDPAASCGLYRSRDRGQSWRLLLETRGEAKGVEVPAARPGHLYVADGSGGVWASDDDGASWRQENEGLGTTSVTGVSAGQDRLYAGTQGSGIYVGTVAPDGSISWDGSDSPRVFVHRIQIEIDPRDGDRLYASAYPGGVLRSDDGGRTWSARNFLTPSIRVDDPNVQGYYAMDIDPTRPDTVWLGVYGKGLIVSHDGRDFGAPADGTDGLLRGAHITSVEVDPRNGRHVLVGAEEGVFETTDRGRTWRRLNRGLGTRDVRAVRVSAAATKPFRADFQRGSVHGFALEPGWKVAGGKLVGKGHAWARAGSPRWTDYSFTSTVKLNGGGVHVNARVNDRGRYYVGVLPNAVYLGKTSGNWRQHRVVAVADATVGSRAHKVRVDVKGPRVRVFL